MEDQNKDVHDCKQAVVQTSDIQNYLASFNREIEEHAPVENGSQQNEETDCVNETVNAPYVTESASNNHLQDYQINSTDQADYTATTYYAVSDGSLFTAPDHSGSSQQISLHPLSSNQTTQVINSHGGMQQIILAVGESNGMTFCGSNGSSMTQSNISLLKGNVQRELLASDPSSNDRSNEAEASAKFIAMNPRTTNRNHIKEEAELTESSIEPLEGENSHTKTIMLVQQPNVSEQLGENGQTIVTGVGKELQIDEERTLQMMANIAEQAAEVSGGSNNSVIVNNGVSYQTVTIVPSDTNPGEVSYVLYLSQAEDMGKNSENVDMSVYDFNEGERYAENVLSDNARPDMVKMRTLRVSPRKSQVSTTTHMCNYCNYTSPKRYLLSRHMKSHSDERPHKCSVCERGFKTLASLQNHVNTHTGTRPHMCRDCDSCFTTSGELVRHVRYKHTHEKPHRCTECDYASVELSKLKRHMRCHTGERPYQCPHCTYASPDTYKLKRHLRIHTGEKPYVCDICQSRFTQSNSLKAHKLIHSGNKPVFQCQFCPTTCGRKTDLRIHVQKLHSCDRPHKCKRCGKLFSDRYSYKVHVKTHEGEKCFKCDLCPYASVSQRHLETHMFIHTDQKPFHCDECDLAFRQKQLLKRHKNLYHDPYYIPPVPKEKNNECAECRKAFRHKGNLIRHLAVHDPKASAAEREEAMLIGRPKGPGELEDGEEDYEYGEDDDYEGRKDGQQLVVFEVIQIPQSNGSIVEDQLLTMEDGQALTLNSGDPQSYTIIQQAPEDSVNVNESLTESENGDVVPNKPRRRGRPRKHPIVTEVHAAELNEETERNDSDSAVEILDKKTRHLRKKKLPDEAFSEEIIFPHTPAKRGRPPKSAQRSPRIVQIVAENKSIPSHKIVASQTLFVQDSESVIKHEQEMARKRLEQKQRDMDECFGFNEGNEDDDNVILAMPAAPGYQNFAQHDIECLKS